MSEPTELHQPSCPVCATPVQAAADLKCGACGFQAKLGGDGIYRPAQQAEADENSREIAYPEEGSDLTMRVEEASFWFTHRNRVIEALLERFRPEGELWDIGGGNGFQARHLQQLGQGVVLVDPSAAGCRNARARGVGRVLEGTLQSFHLPDGKVAAISMFDVLEHLADPDAILAECRRVLRPGGLLYVTVPAYDMLWSDEDVFARHERRYTRASLCGELERNGFHVMYDSYYFQFLVLPILLLRALPYRLRRGSSAEDMTMDESEHLPSPAMKRVLDAFLACELGSVRRGRKLGFGSSVVAVARVTGET